MSLINKMLQDLDARGSQPGPAAVSPEIKPVLAPEPGFPWLRVALLGGLVAVLGASGYVAWRMQQTTAVPAPAPAETPISMTPAKPAARIAAAPAPTQPAVNEAAPAPVDAPKPEPVAALEPEPAPAPKAQRLAAPKAEPVPAPVKQAAPKAVEPPPPNVAQQPAKKEKPPVQRAPVRVAATPAPAPAKPVVAKTPASSGRVETTAQRAENNYRRALASLEDGRVTEATNHLKEALRVDPRHEAARQTLVSLLIESKRPEEAVRQLGAALALDPRQPALAMLLARLQLERGSPGIDTLMRTLPYAANNGDYLAFLAGALQREGRHREAAEQYTAALRTAPQNGVWWMGLGISLLAEKRSAEAADAFQKAGATGSLTPELQAFVERKLKQLAR